MGISDGSQACLYLSLESDAVSRENEINVSGKFGGVAGVFVGANAGFRLRLLCAILSDGVGGIDCPCRNKLNAASNCHWVSCNNCFA